METLTTERPEIPLMFRHVASIICRRPTDILEDSIGLIALFVVLVIGLNLPGMA